MIRRKMRLIAAVGLVVMLTFVLVGGAVAAKPEAKAQVLIGFTQPPGPSEQALIHGVGGTIKYTYRIIPVIAATVPESAIAGLLRNPNVTHVNPDGRVYAIEETLPWGVDRIDAEVVHSTNNGAGVKVAIIDTGIDKDHPDLELNIQDGVNFVAKPWFASPDPDAWDDDSGHGSHVAGTVAAVDNEEGVIGVAPGAYLYGVKVLDSTGSGYWSDVIAGIDWSVSNGMQVINMSLGASSAPDDVETACDNAYDADIVIVAAAGNNGDTDLDDDVIYPAKYASVIAVAAIDSTDTRASWSSDGPDVELAAPGVSIPSTWKDGGYDTKSGTSMASPHVAGTAALVIAWGGLTDLNGDSVVNNEDVRLQLQGTAEDLGATGWDSWYGWGLVDAAAAVGTAPDTTPPAQVTGLTVTTVSSSELDLAWNANAESDLAYYNVYRGTTSGFTPAESNLIASSITNSYSDTGLAADTTYYYKVTAVDTSENGGLASDEASGTTSAAPAIDVTIAKFSARDVRKDNYAISAQIKNEGTTAVTIHAVVTIWVNLTDAEPVDTLSEKEVTIDAGGRVNLKWDDLCTLDPGSYIAKVTVDEEPGEEATDTFEVK